MRSLRYISVAVFSLVLIACGTETPVEFDDLLPGGGIKTGEVILEAPDFLEWDSVRTGFAFPQDVGYLVGARDFDGGLNVNILIKFNQVKETLNYTDRDGETRVDSLPELVAGNIALHLDTLRTLGDDEVEVAAYFVGEDWQIGSANWTHRVDTDTAKYEWAEPGGTRGALIGTGTLTPGDTLLSISVSPEDLADLREYEVSDRGVLFEILTSGSRVQITRAVLHYQTRPEFKPDTLHTDSATMVSSLFLLASSPEARDEIMVGGLPAWRSYMRFQDRLDTIQVPCPGSEGGCTLPLSEVELNHASLELQPVQPQPGFAMVDTAHIETRIVLPLDLAPLPIARAPLGRQLGGFGVAHPSYRGESLRPLKLTITDLIDALTHQRPDGKDHPRTVALIANPEGARIGVATYGGVDSGENAPQLRLIYSVLSEDPDR